MSVHYDVLSPEEWKIRRTKTIGGSDAAAVLGLNPYMTNGKLWEIKTGIAEQADISDKDFVKYGTEAEAHLRGLFALDYPQYTVCYEQGNIWYNEVYPFAHASLDGWLEAENGKKGILEIKTTNILSPQMSLNWDNKIPDNYYCQVLWYLGITGFDFAILKAQLKYDYSGKEPLLVTRHYRVDRADVEADIKYIFTAARGFWGYVERKQRPPLKLPEI